MGGGLRTAATRVAGGARNLLAGITGTAAGGAAAGYSFASIERWISDTTGLEGGRTLRLVLIAAGAIAGIYALGQLLEVHIGGS